MAFTADGMCGPELAGVLGPAGIVATLLGGTSGLVLLLAVHDATPSGDEGGTAWLSARTQGHSESAGADHTGAGE